VRSCYDAVARAYAVRFSGELAHKPLDCDLLRRFAIEVAGRGPVYDLGCGPGQTTAFLHEHGVRVRGLDASPALVAEARRRHPGIDFMVGDMLALPVSDRALGGAVAFFSIVHFSDEQLETALVELFRVLKPDGRILLAFHAGQGTVHVDEFLEGPVSADFRYFDAVEVSADLAMAGFAQIEVVERDPYPGVEFQSRRAYVFASKYGA
jgi:SAM-dependent methyltransferase